MKEDNIMRIEEKIALYLGEEILDEDWEERDLKKKGYVKKSSFGGGMSGKKIVGHTYEHPDTKKKKLVFKKSASERIKHAAQYAMDAMKKKIAGEKK
jgi:hypothetical protein